MGFRGLMGGAWHGSVLTLQLTEQGVLEHLTDVFGEQISAGTLQMEELQRMVAVTFRHIDADGTGSVSCGEFIASFMASELITVPTMARYFDDDIKVGPLRVLLDSSWHERAHEIKKWKAAEQEKKDAESLKGESESNEKTPSIEVLCKEQLAKTLRGAGIEFAGQGAQQPAGSEAVLQRLEALEALNLERRIAQLEADETLRREDSLRITQQEEDEKALKAAFNALAMRIDELDKVMVGFRNEIWREFDNEVIAMRGQLAPIRDRSRESQFNSRETASGGNRGTKRIPWCSTPWSSSSAFLPTDRRLHMMEQDPPPIWDIKTEQATDNLPQRKDLSAAVPNPLSRSWTGLAHVRQPSRENTDTRVSDSCLSKELREDTTGTYSSTYSNRWRSAVDVSRQNKTDL